MIKRNNALALTALFRANTGIRRGLIAALVAWTLVPGLASAEAKAVPWPTTEFVVVLEDPHLNDVQRAAIAAIGVLDNQTGLMDDAMQPHIDRIEAYLHEVALEYQRMQFRAPALPIVDGRYEVNLHPFDAGFGAPARVMCANPTYLEVDVDAVIEWGKWDDRLYEHLAHELFHAVVASYDHCDIDLNRFFTEGVAQALGVDMAFKLRGQEPARSNGGRWGARRYDLPLQQPKDKNDAYQTASFWRYLGEHVSAKAQNKSAGVYELPADYSYLHTIMLAPLSSGDDITVLRWLDTGLKKAINQPLDREYAFFLSTFAGYGEGRYTSATRTADEVKAVAQDTIFDQCQTLSLNAQPAGASTTLNILPLAGECIRIEGGDVTRPEPLTLVIQMVADSAQQLNQIWLGVAGDQKTSKRLAAAGMTATGKHYARWHVDLLPEQQMTLIATNINTNPWNTTPFVGEVSIFSTTGLADSTFVGPLPSASMPPAPSRTGESRNRQAARKLTFNGPSATRVEIDAIARSINISLHATPDILNVLSGINAEGGELEHLITKGEILNETLADMNSAFSNLSALEKSMPGTTIDIDVPYFDYGFTGMVSSALISTNNYDSGQLYAVGPKDSVPGGQREFKPSGTVTIIQYSPTILEGRFVANFTDPNSLTPEQMQESQPTLDIVGTINGYFRIAAPWQDDTRYEPDLSVPPMDDMRYELIARMPAGQEDLVDAVLEAAEEAKRTGRDPDISSIAGSHGTAHGNCDCSCSGMAKLDAMGEAVEKASRAPTPAELSMAHCGLTCMAEYQRCE
ncbi:hypothetical protein [Hyphomonas sp. BRH_c22]|uniref:hypothetical protein n=1 Tax=Hyphomonas sp. BRH_c22 TaxID=1629710 RepID=UPI000AE13DDC|nr:hypothetical protein [Hyphomonas sp. BRH_c22]